MDVKTIHTALEKTRTHKVNQPRWYVIKARIKEEVDRTGEKACQLVVSEYQHFKIGDSGGEETFLF